MLSTTRRLRSTRSLAVGLLVAVAALLPLTPAHAAYGAPLPIQQAIYGGVNNAQLLARSDGTLQFDDGNTKYKYYIELCRVSSFVAPSIRVAVNGVYQYTLFYNVGSATALCPSGYTATILSAEVNHGGTVANVSFTLVASDFINQVYRERTRTSTYDNPYN
ncbi:hypothetical protein [Sphaerisporangium aureirubrum]|uniref:Uncharacterized protein n=1 Tax=Sphaerisporangium aureirubrum TaxID=1544736 RepID=A0ABW1NF06_9ACTN